MDAGELRRMTTLQVRATHRLFSFLAFLPATGSCSQDTYHCDDISFIIVVFFVSPLRNRGEESHAIAPVSDVTRAESTPWAHRGQGAVTFLEIQAVRSPQVLRGIDTPL